jgi:hypothetical protein
VSGGSRTAVVDGNVPTGSTGSSDGAAAALCCVLPVLLVSAVLQEVRSADTVGPVLVHVITEKGRGYLPAETAQVRKQYWRRGP